MPTSTSHGRHLTRLRRCDGSTNSNRALANTSPSPKTSMISSKAWRKGSSGRAWLVSIIEPTSTTTGRRPAFLICSTRARPELAGSRPATAKTSSATSLATLSGVRRIFSLFYAKIMVVGDGQFYWGFGGHWVFWLVRCISECPCQFGTDLALVE